MISGNVLVIGRKNITNIFLTDISDNIEECVLFGLPGNYYRLLTLNFCILYLTTLQNYPTPTKLIY